MTEQTATTTTEQIPTAPPAAPPSADAGAQPPAVSSAPSGSAPAATIMGDAAPAADKPVAAPADWPSDWRNKMAGDNKDALKTLERFASPADMYKSFDALRSKLSSGETKKALPDNPSAEELTAWRKDNGIPEKPDEYVGKIELPKGMVLGEADKPMAAAFAEFAHEANLTPSQYGKMVAGYYQIQDKITAQREEADMTFNAESQDALRKEWGGDYRANVNAIKNLMSTAPQGYMDRLFNGRTADGKKIGDDPESLKFLVGLAREVNPVATLLPHASNPMQGLTERKAHIETLMRDRTSAYWRGSMAAALQQEYRDIINAEARMKARAA